MSGIPLTLDFITCLTNSISLPLEYAGGVLQVTQATVCIGKMPSLVFLELRGCCQLLT